MIYTQLLTKLESGFGMRPTLWSLEGCQGTGCSLKLVTETCLFIVLLSYHCWLDERRGKNL